MNGITPRLTRFRILREWWGIEEEAVWFCTKYLCGLFKIPATASAIWLRWSRRRMSESHRLTVRCDYGEWEWVYKTKRLGLTIMVNQELNKLFPNAKHGDTHNLCIQLQYEE